MVTIKDILEIFPGAKVVQVKRLKPGKTQVNKCDKERVASLKRSN